VPKNLASLKTVRTFTLLEETQKIKVMKTYIVKVYPNGNRLWCNEKNQLHREDGPAVEFTSGTKEWFINGKRHREDDPAVEWVNGDKEWYIKGKRHREDGPAIEYADGSKVWYLNGKLHREGSPAVEYPDGYKVWYINGKRHREDGPAIEYFDGSKEWWVNGKRLTKEEFNNRNKVELTLDEIASKFGISVDQLKIKK